jgi:hypothetical protein
MDKISKLLSENAKLRARNKALARNEFTTRRDAWKWLLVASGFAFALGVAVGVML